MLLNNSSVLDESCLNGLSETYLALGVPCDSVILAIQKMKYDAITIANDPNGILSADSSNLIAELGGYFDYIVAALNLKNTKIADHLQDEYQGFNISKIDAERIDQENFLDNSVNNIFSEIDKELIEMWINEEADEEPSLLTVRNTYTLNLNLSVSKLGNIPGGILSESFTQQGLDTEWVVSSSTVQLKTKTTNAFLEGIPIRGSNKTVWTENFSLYVPIYGDSKTVQLDIKPVVAENVYISVLKDFQRIKYTVNKNDNHFKGGEGLPTATPLSPNKYAREMSAQRQFLNAVSRIDINYFCLNHLT